MSKNQVSYFELENSLRESSKNESVFTIRVLIFLTRVVKFLFSKLFLFIVTITPFIVLMWFCNFNLFWSSIYLIIHLIYWIVINLINYKIDSSNEINKLNKMIEIYNSILLEKRK